MKKYLTDYNWLIKVYVAYNKRFKKRNIDELKIESLSKKTTKLIQQTIDVKEIEDRYPTLSIDKDYIKTLEKTPTRDIGAAIDLATNIQVEIKQHPTSPFFMSLREDVEKTYEELRNRKIETEEAIQRLLTIGRRIVKWKKNEDRIGKDRYAVYQAIIAIIPELEEQTVLKFIEKLLKDLREKGLLFKGWQRQRGIRRKVRGETRILLLTNFKKWRNKIDDLTEGVFRALEEIEQ